jgi:type 1 fimbriae regulatory protein FimB
MSATALKAVRRWLRARRDDTGCGAVWTTDVGEALTFWAVQAIFRRVRERSGVKRLHAHLLRHTFGQVAIEKGAERALVQDMMGHTTDRMTRRYTQTVRSQDAAKQMPRFAAR